MDGPDGPAGLGRVFEDLPGATDCLVPPPPFAQSAPLMITDNDVGREARGESVPVAGVGGLRLLGYEPQDLRGWSTFAFEVHAVQFGGRLVECVEVEDGA